MLNYIKCALLFPLLLAMMSSCEKKICITEEESTKLNVELGVKSASDPIDVSLYVYGGDGRLVSEAAGVGSKQFSLRKHSSYDLIALSGIEYDRSGIASKSYFDTLTISLNEDMTSESDIPRIAKARVNLDEGPSLVSLNLSSIVSRIIFNRVDNNLDAAFGTLKLMSVYLSNVPSKYSIEEALTFDNHWINYKGRLDSYSDILYKNINRQVPQGSSYSPGFNFYSFPSYNGSTNPLRLVLVTQIGENIYYYPVTLNSLEANTSYQVNVNIKNLGSSHPDIPLDCAEIVISPGLGEWKNSNTISVNFN